MMMTKLPKMNTHLYAYNLYEKTYPVKNTKKKHVSVTNYRFRLQIFLCNVTALSKMWMVSSQELVFMLIATCRECSITTKASHFTACKQDWLWKCSTPAFTLCQNYCNYEMTVICSSPSYTQKVFVFYSNAQNTTLKTIILYIIILYCIFWN